MDKMCKNCGTSWEKEVVGKMFCSDSCRMRWQKRRASIGKGMFDNMEMIVSLFDTAMDGLKEFTDYIREIEDEYDTMR